jgi:hypothetical protein
MIEVIFIFENAYTFGDVVVEELRRWLPAIPRKGDVLDFTDYLYTVDDEGNEGGAWFVVDGVSFLMTKEDGQYDGVLVSLIPEKE